MTNKPQGILRSLGPAIIVAAVVCGPGSILTASKVGAQHGYAMIWALALAIVLMIGATALAARIGAIYEGTPCDELAKRLGRPVAFLVGLTIFLVAAGFQTSNNLAVIKAVSPYLDADASPGLSRWLPVIVILALNGFLLFVVYRSRHLYGPVEKAMKLLVGLMVLAFLANCIATRPSLVEAAKGLVPRIPDTLEGAGSFFAVAGMIATTFSIAGAFYQAYLVRDKGWGVGDLKRGLVDSVIGILALGTITLVIMLTAASQFFGKADAAAIGKWSVTDVSTQLEALFGPWAGVIFTVGIFAGALSSFLVNSMIGGQFLADGMGKGGSMDAPTSRHGTALALLTGMIAGIAAFLLVDPSEQNKIAPLIIAQASTVIGGPALAGALLYLATRPDLEGERRTPRWMLALGWLGFAVVCVLAVRMVTKLAG